MICIIIYNLIYYIFILNCSIQAKIKQKIIKYFKKYMFYIFHICNCISPQISINFRLCLAALEANNWTQKFREWSYLRDVFMFHFWMCFVKGIIQVLIDHFDSFRERVKCVMAQYCCVCCVCFFHMKWVWKILIESSSIGAWARVLVIGHAHSESHIIWIHHFHLSAVAGSWFESNFLRSKATQI